MIIDQNLIIEEQKILVGDTNHRQNAQIKPEKMAKILTLLGNIYQDKYATKTLS